MNRPQVWKAFHDAFAALPADFLATVTMSSIIVDEDIVKLIVWVERGGRTLEACRMEDMRMVDRVPIGHVARISWEMVIRQFGYSLPPDPVVPVRVLDLPPRNGGTP